VNATIRAVLLLVGALLVLAGTLVYSLVRHGLSTKDEPTRVEQVVARTVRHLATPAADRARRNPVPLSDAVLNGALEHFADHCALCHANDGSGDTTIGRGLYPKAPDMRANVTQSLSDGELFAIIEHGVRLTGMPAWGTGSPDGERESWDLVHFIRHLPKLTAEERERMEALNPKTPGEVQEEEEAQGFLRGEQPAPTAGDQPKHHH